MPCLYSCSNCPCSKSELIIAVVALVYVVGYLLLVVGGLLLIFVDESVLDGLGCIRVESLLNKNDGLLFVHVFDVWEDGAVYYISYVSSYYL